MKVMVKWLFEHPKVCAGKIVCFTSSRTVCLAEVLFVYRTSLQQFYVKFGLFKSQSFRYDGHNGGGPHADQKSENHRDR
jgi:hypothetical protein